jgi:hypothetical protein
VSIILDRRAGVAGCRAALAIRPNPPPNGYDEPRLRQEGERMTPISASPKSSAPVLSCDQVLKIANVDAEKAYRDLSPFRIEIVLKDDGWHIDYELKDPQLNGGGPHYVIDAATGAIVTKRYEQ